MSIEAHDRLEDLINRMEQVVGSSERPVMLHWSDVELLRNLAIERRELARRAENLKHTLSRAVDDLMNQASSKGERFAPREPPGSGMVLLRAVARRTVPTPGG